MRPERAVSGIGAGVRRAEHRLLDRDAGEVRAELHHRPGFHVGRVHDDTLEAVGEQAPRLVRERVRQRRAARRHRGLDGMRDRVDARRGRNGRRSAGGQLGIEDRDAERGRRIAARHLHVRAGIGDHRVALRLAAGAGGRGNADRRQQRRRGLAVAAVLAHLAAVGEQEIDPLGAVERAAAADGDDRIERTVLPGERAPRATMTLSGFSAKSENGTTASDAASSERWTAAA